MQNNDDALLSISLAGHGQLLKMLITLEPHGVFSLNFAYLYIIRLSSVYQIKLNMIDSKNYVTLNNLSFLINSNKPFIFIRANPISSICIKRHNIRKQPIIVFYSELETVAKFYNLKARPGK